MLSSALRVSGWVVGTISTVHLWEPATGQALELGELEPGGTAFDVGFSPDGSVIASTGALVVRFWTSGGDSLEPIRHSEDLALGDPTSIEFGADGSGSSPLASTRSSKYGTSRRGD